MVDTTSHSIDGLPNVYHVGVTVYNPERAFRGYTLFQAPGQGALLIDLNGREVQLWQGLQGFPNKLLPGGQVFGSTGERDPRHGAQDQVNLGLILLRSAQARAPLSQAN